MQRGRPWARGAVCLRRFRAHGRHGPADGEGVLELSRREPLDGGLQRFDWNLYFGECAGHDPFAELALEPRRLHDLDKYQHRYDAPCAWQRGDSGICEKAVRKNWIQTGICRRAVVDFDVNASSSVLYRSHGVD